MLARAALDAMRGFPEVTFEAAFGDGPILVLAPHPDDESLGCGGLIAEACARGHPVRVAVLTDGSRSHPNSAAFPGARLRALRESETLKAVARLGLRADHVAFMRYPDTAAPARGAALVEAATRLADLIKTAGSRTVVVSWRHDPHCDHEAAAAIAAIASNDTAARLLAYPIWGWTLPPEQLVDEVAISGFRLDIARHLDRKRAAILAHESQYAGLIEDDPTGFQMPEGFIDRFLQPTEIFVNTANSP